MHRQLRLRPSEISELRGSFRSVALLSHKPSHADPPGTPSGAERRGLCRVVFRRPLSPPLPRLSPLSTIDKSSAICLFKLTSDMTERKRKHFRKEQHYLLRSEITRQWFIERACVSACMKVSVAQSCPTLVIPWTVARQAPLSMGFSQQESWGVSSHSLLQGIFPTQRSNPGLLHCRWILSFLSHQRGPVCMHTLFFNAETLPESLQPHTVDSPTSCSPRGSASLEKPDSSTSQYFPVFALLLPRISAREWAVPFLGLGHWSLRDRRTGASPSL